VSAGPQPQDDRDSHRRGGPATDGPLPNASLPNASLSPDFLLDLFRNPLDPGYADAAARREGTPPRLRPGGRMLTVLALMVIGTLLAVSYQQVVQDAPTRSQVRAELVDQVHQRNATTQALEQQVDDLRADVSRLRDEQLTGPQARLLRDLEAATGLARVTGDGVVVRVSDGPDEPDPVTGAVVAEARILDYDLQQIANALWAAGAEAVAINDRRLTTTSTIRHDSGAILVNRLPVAGPYEVVAVGPQDLRGRFIATGADDYLQELAKRYGVAYELRAERDLVLPAALHPDLHHAAPAGGRTTTGGDR
jgi:uncharacterized protein YlxW (UPF0749 family)